MAARFEKSHVPDRGVRANSKRSVHMVVLCLFILTLVSAPFGVWAQGTESSTNTAALRQLAEIFKQRLESRQTQLYYDLLESTDPAARALNLNPDIQLMFIRESGVPMYYEVHNLNAARTISTDEVWPGGSTGYNLTGAGTAGNQLAIWDGGGVRTTHTEFGGRVTQQDVPGGLSGHSTHVAGTMVAAGVVAAAQGMSYQANLDAYEWTSDDTEMANGAAAGLLVSNHSYGFATGWGFNNNDGNWYWYGDVNISSVEAMGFGFYSTETQAWDQIAYNAPDYLIVKSSGNDRNDAGPAAGTGHFHWDGGWVWATDVHDIDGGPNGYDCIPWRGNAKNILTVGAVEDIPAGYSVPADVVQTTFSSWGPTDDGRIKPDIVANGDDLYSLGSGGDNSYGTRSGTSMSAPNASGSINLLIRHYESEKGSTPRAATMKATVIHTADEAGPSDGPDYENGWGLMNTETAADLIAAGPPSQTGIVEATLDDGDVDTYSFNVTTFAEHARATIVWTDPPGTPPADALDPTTPMLVNDLDLRVEHLLSATTYRPWRLDGANPANAATKGDNAVDNVEVIDIDNLAAGTYELAVSHKGSLDSGEQAYSIIWSVSNQVPEAIAGPDLTVECASCTGTPVTLDGTGSYDPDGDPLTYLWSATGVTFDDATSPTPTGTFPLGTTTVTLTVSDGEFQDTDTVDITIVDTIAPDVTCPADITVECACFCGVPADDPQLVPFFAGFSATDICDCDLDITDDRPSCFPLGATVVTFTATDDSGNQSTCAATVTVIDTTPPTITVELNRDVLWPPNHKMADISAVITVEDVCDSLPEYGLLSITSNEPDDNKGDGKTTGDIVIISDAEFQLRSERMGMGDGRIYTIIHWASDASGNEAFDTSYVRVPHNQSGSAMASLGFTADGTNFDPSFERFVLVIPSKLGRVIRGDNGSLEVVEGGLDATQLDVNRVYVGNVRGVVLPDESLEIDVDGNGLEDLALYYSVAATMDLLSAPEDEGKIKISRSYGPIGLHYQSVDGIDYLVSNIFELGEPVALSPEEPPVVLDDGDSPPSEELSSDVPKVTEITSIYPNPFNPSTTIRFALVTSGTVTLRIYDARGVLIRTLLGESLPSGVHEVLWDGRDHRGQHVASGIYFAHLVAGDVRTVRKMVMLK